MISSLTEICKELNFLHKSSLNILQPEERKPNEKFIKNSIFQIRRKQFLSIAMETRKIDAWTLNDDLFCCCLTLSKQVSFTQIT
jgi:N utilization substance protein B